MSMPFSPCPTDGSACSDASISILGQVFGPVVQKLATGGAAGEVSAATNTLASMVSVYNSGIMTVGGLLVSAIIFGSVMQTANDGEVMGKEWSTPNTIMRIVAGGGALLPTASGYSIIQMIVLTITLWAVGLANTIYRQGVEVGIIQGDLASTTAQMGTTDRTINESYALADLRKFAEGLTQSLYCARVANATYLTASGNRSAVQTASEPDSTTEDSGRTAKNYWFSDRNKETNVAGGRSICGGITLYDLKPLASTDPEIMALSPLRNAVYSAKRDAAMSMYPALQNWVSTWPSSIDQTGHDNIESNRLNEIVRDAENKFLAALSGNVHSDATLQGIMSAYVDRITENGWMYAGGYYQRMGDIRSAITKMIAEPVASTSGPNLNGLPSSEQSRIFIQSVNAVPGIVFARALDRRTTVTPADIGTVIQASMSAEDASVDAINAKTEEVFSAWVNSAMQGVTATLLGTSGDVDAIARIKAAGDVLATINATAIITDKAIYTGITAARIVAATGGSIRILGSGVNLEPTIKAILDWTSYVILDPLKEMTTWLERGAFWFGVFLPSLPYNIFLVAALGFILQVLQTLVAVPLWAIMHMTPEKTFIGSQTQGYLLLLSLFVRPALMMIGLFAAFALINPVLNVVTEAFFTTRSGVNNGSNWFIQFLQLKNWLVVYGLLLTPVMFMVFGLSHRLPDAVLSWLNIGTSNLGHTDATSEMRSQTEKYGPTPALGQQGQRPLPGPRGSPSGNPSIRPGNGGSGSSRGGSSGSLPLLNDQGVSPSTGSTKN